MWAMKWKAIWKGSHNPRNWGRNRSPWLWTTYPNWDDPPRNQPVDSSPQPNRAFLFRIGGLVCIEQRIVGILNDETSMTNRRHLFVGKNGCLFVYQMSTKSGQRNNMNWNTSQFVLIQFKLVRISYWTVYRYIRLPLLRWDPIFSCRYRKKCNFLAFFAPFKLIIPLKRLNPQRGFVYFVMLFCHAESQVGVRSFLNHPVWKRHSSRCFCSSRAQMLSIIHTHIFTVYSFNWLYMGVSKNRGTPKWMVYNGKHGKPY